MYPNTIILQSIFKLEDNQTVIDNQAMIIQLLDKLYFINENEAKQ